VKRFNSQTFILIGATLFVLYLAGVPLVMLLYGSIRSAPIAVSRRLRRICSSSCGVA